MRGSAAQCGDGWEEANQNSKLVRRGLISMDESPSPKERVSNIDVRINAHTIECGTH